MRTHLYLSLGLLGALTTFAVQAAEPGAPLSGSAQLLASNCFNCHGTDGRSRDTIPPLAGLPQKYLADAMADYREGKRDATIMHQLAKGYTEQDISLIAHYFSQQKP